jgi:Na+/H+ antiporter NhaD/arsenite permease-like protein
MLLIRPLLQTNRERKRVAHTVVFFIFLVSNIGGCLTPLGDPPLFLGYLAGVPFAWTLRLLPEWLFTVALVLAVYVVWDRRERARETVADLKRDFYEVRPLRIAGKDNLVLLLGVLAAVGLAAGAVARARDRRPGLALLLRTDRALHEANRFTFRPILEVAALFAGIFVTMLPALDLLRARGAELGVREPWQFFWASGMLSSFPRQRPYLPDVPGPRQGLGPAARGGGACRTRSCGRSAWARSSWARTATSATAQLHGARDREERGVRMPSFGGYMLYSGLVLLPIFVIVTLVFFR